MPGLMISVCNSLPWRFYLVFYFVENWRLHTILRSTDKQKYWQWFQFGNGVKIAKLTYAIIDPLILQSMGFSPYSNKIHKFNIPSTAFSEQTTKYNVRLYFCLYSITIYVYITNTYVRVYRMYIRTLCPHYTHIHTYIL